MRAFVCPEEFLVDRRRASALDARNRGTQSVPQTVRAKRVRPFHTYVSAHADTYIIHTCAYGSYPDLMCAWRAHAFIGPTTQKNVRMESACAPTGQPETSLSGHMRTCGSTCGITFVGAHPPLMRAFDCLDKILSYIIGST